MLSGPKIGIFNSTHSATSVTTLRDSYANVYQAHCAKKTKLRREHMYINKTRWPSFCAAKWSQICSSCGSPWPFYFKSRKIFIIPTGSTATWDLPSFTLIPPGVGAVLFQSLQLKRKSTRKQTYLTCVIPVRSVNISLLVQFSTKAIKDFHILQTLFSSSRRLVWTGYLCYFVLNYICKPIIVSLISFSVQTTEKNNIVWLK